MARTNASKKPTNQEAAELPIKILKKANRKTLAGTSNLGYQLGLDDYDNLFWCIESNSGGGMFSQEWISRRGSDEPRSHLDLLY